MTYEIYRNIFVFSTILAGIMLIVSVVLFVKWNIPKAIRSMTGRQPVKAIGEPAASSAIKSPEVPCPSAKRQTTGNTTADLGAVMSSESETHAETGIEVEVDITYLQTDEVIMCLPYRDKLK